MKKRWRKRLEDLKQLIRQAENTYFDPNLFRLNINNAIQTSRTVTFLIQKEKQSIPDFDAWYKKHVLDASAGDKIMSWLKDARNTIEKEGDLDVHSYWKVSHLFSYTEEGERLICEEKEALFSNINAVRKMAKERVPEGIFLDSALVIDRCWIANTLPDYELIDAVTYGYRKLAHIVDELDKHIGMAVDSPTLHDEVLFVSQTRRAYLKLSDSSIYMLEAKVNTIKKRVVNMEAFKAITGEGGLEFHDDTKPLQVRVESLASIAKNLAQRDGGHITICFLFGQSRSNFQIVHPDFKDHVDKLIFFHEIAFVARMTGLVSLFFVSEAWLRDGRRLGNTRISELKVIGEALEVAGISKGGEVHAVQFKVERSGKHVRLERLEEMGVHAINYLNPLKRTWGFA